MLDERAEGLPTIPNSVSKDDENKNTVKRSGYEC